MKILKFGGSSIATPERVNKVRTIIKTMAAQEPVAVVVSAFGGVTDQLVEMSRLAAAGEDAYLKIFRDVEQTHVPMLKSIITAPYKQKTLSKLHQRLETLRNLLQGVFLLKERSPRALDAIMSFGERLSAFILAESLTSDGVPADYLDASRLIKTDDHFGSAVVDYEWTYRNIADYFAANKSLQIITGFIASTPNNEITTLGRGGSDYTASIFGAALRVSEIQIWSDVNGVMTADPRIVPGAFPIKNMTYEEAMEMSHFGSKVIHPKAIQPALERNIPVRIKNTFAPDFEGTLIQKKSIPDESLIRGVSSISEIALLRVHGSGMIGVAGIAARLFGALARQKINVMLITQASSEHSICFAVDPHSADMASKVIAEEFDLEILAHQINPVIVEKELAVVAAVGENMRGTPGIAGRIFQALGQKNINVVAIAQGSSELNVSIVVDKRNEATAINAMHQAFFSK